MSYHPDDKADIWWQAYLAALSGASSDQTIDNAKCVVQYAERIADATLDMLAERGADGNG